MIQERSSPGFSDDNFQGTRFLLIALFGKLAFLIGFILCSVAESHDTHFSKISSTVGCDGLTNHNRERQLFNPTFGCSCIRSHASPTFQRQYFQVPQLFDSPVAGGFVLFIGPRGHDRWIIPFTGCPCAPGWRIGGWRIDLLCSGMGFEQQGEMSPMHDPALASETLSEESTGQAIAWKLSPASGHQRVVPRPLPMPLLWRGYKNSAEGTPDDREG